MEFFETPDSQETSVEVLTVSEVTRNIKVILETAIPVLWLEGEVSNFKHHSSGHMYFSLKDENAQMPCVMWVSRNLGLRFCPEDGMKVVAQGRITVYERRGQYQLEVLQMQPAGIGALQLAFEQLKQRLSNEGLFDEENKKPLPQFPQRIGIVTSPTGAAIRDLRSVIQRRWPSAQLILRPALVQGPGAAEDIAAAIAEFNEFGEVNVLIVGRGGGSLEDLWAFNEEVVARAIFASEIPVISAVGHEIDFTIADFVADLRAPTPSVAGELVVPDAKEVMQEISHQLSRAYRHVLAQIRHGQERLRTMILSYGLRRPVDIVHQHMQNLDELQRRLEAGIKTKIQNDRMRLDAAARHLQALSFQGILQRGFSITRDKRTGVIVKSVQATAVSQEVNITFHDGEVDATVLAKRDNL